MTFFVVAGRCVTVTQCAVEGLSSAVKFFLYYEAIGTGLKEGRTTIFQCVGEVGVYSGWFVSASQAYSSYNDPSEVKFLGIGRVVRAVDLFPYFMDPYHVSSNDKHDGSLWVRLGNLVSYASQVSVVQSSLTSWNFRPIIWDLITFNECWHSKTRLAIGGLNLEAVGPPASCFNYSSTCLERVW